MSGRGWRSPIANGLRGALGIAFPWLLTMIPAEERFVAPLVAVGVLLYIAARIGSAFEPECLRRGGGRGVNIGEAVFVSSALAMALVLVSEADIVDINPGVGIVGVILYLLGHAIVLPILTSWMAEKTRDAPARPALRRFVFVGAFVAEEATALMCISLAAHAYNEARQGPWGLWDLVPISPLIALAVCYLPLLYLETAANPRLTREEASAAAYEGALLQVGAITVAACTGTLPWV